MKKSLLCAGCFFICVIKSFAQAPPTDIFSGVVSKYTASLEEVKTLLNITKNKLYNFKLTGGKSLNLLINMNEWNDENTHTVGSKILDCEECYLTLTLYTDKGKPAITGEIFSKIKNEAFKISLNEAGIISFEKTDKDKIIIE